MDKPAVRSLLHTLLAVDVGSGLPWVAARQGRQSNKLDKLLLQKTVLP